MLQRMNSSYRAIYFFTSIEVKNYRLIFRQKSQVLMSRNSRSRSTDHILRIRWLSFRLLIYKGGVLLCCVGHKIGFCLFVLIFIKILFLSNLYTQHRVRTHNSKIKSDMLRVPGGWFSWLSVQLLISARVPIFGS